MVQPLGYIPADWTSATVLYVEMMAANKAFLLSRFQVEAAVCLLACFLANLNEEKWEAGI